MWITRQLAEAGKKQLAADVSRITAKEEAASGAYSADLVYCGPWGILYSPPSYAKGVVVDSLSGKICVGAEAETMEKNIAPGELYLFSKGGASIYLKNTGEVVINGQVFSSEQEEDT